MAVCPNCHEQNPEAGAPCPRCEGFHYVPDDAVEEAETDPLIGTKAAGKYVILSLISEGGMGAVYRALQLPVEREVAFKVLRTELKDSDNGRDRFIREARAVSRLNHANIITLYDFGFEDGKHPYMVMEYAPGKSLAKWLRTERVTTERIFRIAAQILSALTEAHQHGIVHRDLKPENMIISPRPNDSDRVKLLDFGIARMINEGATKGLTREGEVFGTPDYMAPEQAQGKKSIGPPADIYAVGIMLWEMVCGRCPFEAPTPLAVLFMHINDPLPEIQPREGLEVPPGLVHMIKKAAAKKPQERYQSAGEMLADLNNLIATSTGMHPGALTGEISREFRYEHTPAPVVDQQMQTGRTLAHTPVPNRDPHFTPAPGSTPGVRVQDPDPSFVDHGAANSPGTIPPGQDGSGTIPPLGGRVDTAPPGQQIQTFPPGEQAASRRRTIGIVALIAGVVVIGLTAAAFAVLSGDSTEPDVPEPEIAEATPDEAETEIASTDQTDEIEVEQLEPKDEGDEAGDDSRGAADKADAPANKDIAAEDAATERLQAEQEKKAAELAAKRKAEERRKAEARRKAEEKERREAEARRKAEERRRAEARRRAQREKEEKAKEDEGPAKFKPIPKRFDR